MWFKKKEIIEEVDYLEFAGKAIDYIKARRLLGIKDDTIRKEMSAKDYPETLIEYLFQRVENVKPKLTFEEEVYKTLRLGKKWLLKHPKQINKAFELMLKRINERRIDK